MFRKIFWINLGLLVIIVLLTYNLYRFWSRIIKDIRRPAVQVELPDASKKLVAEELEEEFVDFKPSSRMSYTPVVEKDLFRPEREEWQPPPPPEEDDTELKQTSTNPIIPGQRQPDLQDPTLHGIIIIGESKKYALMQGYLREEPEQRTRKIPMGNGQFREVPLPPLPGKVVKDRIRAYKIGDDISESRIVEILPDKVVLEKESGERYEIILREQVKLDKWKPGSDDMQTAGLRGQMQGGASVPSELRSLTGDVEQYPIPPGIPIYPPAAYVPMYPPSVPPPGFVPSPPPQVGQVAPGQVPRMVPTPPGFIPGRMPIAPPGQFFTGQPR